MEQLDYLDPKTKLDIVNLLLELSRDGKATVMVSHNNYLLKYDTNRLDFDLK